MKIQGKEMEMRDTDGKRAEEATRKAITKVKLMEIEEKERVDQLPKRRPRKKKVKPHPLEGKVVRGSGPAYWLIEGGKRRLIPTMQEFYRIGLQTVIRLPDNELQKINEGTALR